MFKMKQKVDMMDVRVDDLEIREKRQEGINLEVKNTLKDVNSKKPKEDLSKIIDILQTSLDSLKKNHETLKKSIVSQQVHYRGQLKTQINQIRDEMKKMSE